MIPLHPFGCVVGPVLTDHRGLLFGGQRIPRSVRESLLAQMPNGVVQELHPLDRYVRLFQRVRAALCFYSQNIRMWNGVLNLPAVCFSRVPLCTRPGERQSSRDGFGWMPSASPRVVGTNSAFASSLTPSGIFEGVRDLDALLEGRGLGKSPLRASLEDLGVGGPVPLRCSRNASFGSISLAVMGWPRRIGIQGSGHLQAMGSRHVVAPA